MGCRNLAPAVWNNQTTTKHLSAFHSFIWTALILKPQTSRNLRLWEWVLFWSLLPPERHSRWILFWHSADPSWTDFIMKKKLFSFFCFVLFFSFVLSFYSSSPFLSFPFTWWKCRSWGSCIFWALFLFKLHTDCTNVEDSHWFDNSRYCALPYTFFFCWWIMFTWLL